MSKLHVKTGDTVVLLTGDYKDKYEEGGKTTRVGHGFETKTNAAGKEKNIPVRICKKCGHNF